jgi:hypothetical protein
MDDKMIFILFSCNEWKERSSMRLIVATTDEDKLRAIIAQEILEDNMEYAGMSKYKGVTAFNNNDNKDYDNLKYGYVEIVYDGEPE